MQDIKIRFYNHSELDKIRAMNYRYQNVDEDNLGFADPLLQTVYVLDTKIPELNKYLINHEVSHLFEMEGTDEDEFGIRHKSKKFFKEIFMPAITGGALSLGNKGGFVNLGAESGQKFQPLGPLTPIAKTVLPVLGGALGSVLSPGPIQKPFGGSDIGTGLLGAITKPVSQVLGGLLGENISNAIRPQSPSITSGLPSSEIQTPSITPSPVMVPSAVAAPFQFNNSPIPSNPSGTNQGPLAGFSIGNKMAAQLPGSFTGGPSQLGTGLGSSILGTGLNSFEVNSNLSPDQIDEFQHRRFGFSRPFEFSKPLNFR